MEKELIPNAHRTFLKQAVETLSRTPGITGVAIGGSYLTTKMDEFSDLDIVIGAQPAEYERILAQRSIIAASLGNLLGAFTGEHVGEPRLLICLYNAPLLHVDLKFVKDTDLSLRVEDPVVLWQRDGSFGSALQEGRANFPTPQIQWVEERFWIWVHYGASKIGRGELFEAIDFLGFLRSHVLGPLALHQAGLRANGVRRIETLLPEFSSRLKETLCGHDAKDCCRALEACVEIYRDLRYRFPMLETQDQAEKAAMEYFAEICRSKS